MSQDQVRSPIDALRARLQDELDALGQKQAEAVEVARRAAETAAEQQWAAKVEAVRAEWSARLESEVAAARTDAQRRLASESSRLMAEAQQAATDSAARVRAELEQALAAERQRASAQVEADRQKLEHERRTFEDERRHLQQELAAEREKRGQLERDTATRESAQSAQAAASAAALTSARAAERDAQLAAFERLLGAFRTMDAARSLSEALTALARAAAAEAPRAALFIANGSELQGWKAEGFSGAGPTSLRVPIADASLLGQVFRGGEALTASAGTGRTAPDFAALPRDRAAIAVPITVGGVAVAVLYADDAAATDHQAPAAWPETIQILGRHASACVAQLTAIRTAQAARFLDAAAPRTAANAADDATGGNSEDDNGARRYARLLVSEIKLYNEGAVRAGREKRDLLHRLRDEIERARRLYEERIPPAVAGRQAYFQQELVQTLAGGDPACLGGQA